MKKHYAERDIAAMGQVYDGHVSAMTSECLHSKACIAAELAYRDIEIAKLKNAFFEIKNAILRDSCDGDSGFSDGVKAAIKHHLSLINHIYNNAGVDV